MKKLLYTLPLLLTGCITNPATGAKKLFGLFPIPGGGVPVEDLPMKVQVIGQLAPLIYVAIPLIIAGALWWRLSGGSTGLGKISVGLGLGFIAIAVILPQIIIWLKWIVLLVLVLAIAYSVWYFFKKKK